MDRRLFNFALVALGILLAWYAAPTAGPAASVAAAADSAGRRLAAAFGTPSGGRQIGEDRYGSAFDAAAEASRQRQLDAVDLAIGYHRRALSAAAFDAASAKTLLDSIVISDATFRQITDGDRTRGLVDLTVRNVGAVPVQVLHLVGSLRTSGRTVPWVRDRFAVALDGGLEPGESRELSVEPSPAGEWSDTTLMARAPLALDLRLIDVEDSNGRRLARVDLTLLERSQRELERLEDKRRALLSDNATAALDVASVTR